MQRGSIGKGKSTPADAAPCLYRSLSVHYFLVYAAEATTLFV